MNKVVCNSSPIIGLCLLMKIDLLWELFDEVIIPQEVYNDVKDSRSDRVISISRIKV